MTPRVDEAQEIGRAVELGKAGLPESGMDEAPDRPGLILFGAVYTFIFSFGTYYIYRLLRAGPAGYLVKTPRAAVPNRPMSLAEEEATSVHSLVRAGE